VNDKLLPFGNAKKNKFSFGISLTYSILWLSPKLLPFGNAKKNKFSFGISLTYS